MFYEVGVKINEDFQLKTRKNINLFIYSSGVARFGFLAKIEKDTDLTDTIRSWENTIVDDFNPLLSYLIGKETEKLNNFRTWHYKGNEFRCIDLNEKNFGICLSTIEDWFLFTTSGESMLRLIDILSAETSPEI